ncbi:MAG: sigma-70 family RNA polymerase sigma factor [Armatimonadetes bacterium]|nr:sigma-70 family RNA polymerase sigma factor [Armatimonadota bacterium]NIO75292.1 sigma-70 family RNA polymerase sigma factor [Armatimonadota bacterium]NIO95852.1 sigma-70 family RNA polymerase sigma factor [Armatimonadota bacterium]
METDTITSTVHTADRLDQSLVDGLRRGDHAAHGLLCDRYGPMLYGFAAARLAGDSLSAEEVVAQTLTDVCRNIRVFNPNRSAFGTWVYGIARRKIQSLRRKLLSKKSLPAGAQVSLDSILDAVADSDAESGMLGQLEARSVVERLTQVLSDSEMEALTLHYVEGFSFREIGRIIGRSEKAADSLVRRAKQKARERLVRDD